MALTVNIPPRIDWKAERDRIDLAALVARLLGCEGKARGGRLWWCCPLHEEDSPSFFVKPGKRYWRCYGCAEHGDAAALVMRVLGKTFPEALEWIFGDAPAMRPRRAPGRPPEHSRPPNGRTVGAGVTGPPRATGADRKGPPSTLGPDQASALVEAAAARLWTPAGTEALAYLTGRGLEPETIRAARLGWTGRAEGLPWSPPGLVIPWFDPSGHIVFLKVRPPAAWRDAFPPERRPPKYLAPRGWPAPGTIYPGPATIRAGRPLVIVEGELDALLLGQALGELAAAVTLGGASSGPDTAIRGAMLSAPSWFIAHDADEAGDKAAAAWTAYGRARRVRPPAPFKDWSEAATDTPGTIGTALDLRRWWAAILAGDEAPPPFSRDDLARWRWGAAALESGATGIDSRGPADSDELAERLAAGALDPEAGAERAAIQAEPEATREPSTCSPPVSR